MPTTARIGKRERPPRPWYMKFFDNLRSQLTWTDTAVGLLFSAVIALLLTGLQYPKMPEYRAGTIATQEVRAPQEIIYEDLEATEQRRAAARASIPALYELDSQLIESLQQAISGAFSAARGLLVERSVPPQGAIPSRLQQEVLTALEQVVGKALPPDLLPLLLKHRFSIALEGQIIKTLDTVLRAGIVADKAMFLEDRQDGIVVRDSISPVERSLASGYRVRDLQDARQQLGQFELEFLGLPGADRAGILRALSPLLVPTLLPRVEETRRRREAAAERIPAVEVRVRQGTILVRSGEEVTPAIVKQLETLRNLYRPRSLAGQYGGYLFFTLVLAYSLWRYFVHYQTRHRKIRNHAILILVVLICVLSIMRLMSAAAGMLGERLSLEALRDPLGLYYAIPFAAGGILVTLLVDTSFGILAATVIAALSGLFYADAYVTVYALNGGLAGIFGIRHYKDRAAILKAGLTIGLVNVCCIPAITLVRQAPLVLGSVAPHLAYGCLGGILAAAVASTLLPVLESLFKITTDIRLLELSNLNAPVLRRLSVAAPGTYHHSLMVGTLSEAAAEAIGANALLARVGAYYHDLGKMLKPEYFVENQLYEANKHENLTPNMSSLIIASHVKDGIELAKQIGLPGAIQDMIPQHHGTRVMTYFYRKAKETANGKNGEVAEADFRYPGPKPQTREAAIMMMADAVEAASRTLSNPSPAQIQGMINRLVDAVVADNQFDECDITMRDIRMVKHSFFKILTGLYHKRVDYPGYDFRQVGEESDSGGLQAPGVQPSKST